MIRLSGTLANRPSSTSAVNARYYATDEEQVYFSTGDHWLPKNALGAGEDNGLTSGATLADRPNANDSIGYVWTDVETGNQYEAFPNAWALISNIAGATFANGQQLKDADGNLFIDCATRKTYKPTGGLEDVDLTAFTIPTPTGNARGTAKPTQFPDTFTIYPTVKLSDPHGAAGGAHVVTWNAGMAAWFTPLGEYTAGWPCFMVYGTQSDGLITNLYIDMIICPDTWDDVRLYNETPTAFFEDAYSPRYHHSVFNPTNEDSTTVHSPLFETDLPFLQAGVDLNHPTFVPTVLAIES